MREPIQVDLYVQLGLVVGKHSWSASIDSVGNGRLKVFQWSRGRFDPVERPFHVSRSEVGAFRGALFRTSFFALRDVYGREASDTTYRWIRVRLGQREKAIWIQYAHPEELRAAGTYEEARELLLQVWQRAAAWLNGVYADDRASARLPDRRPGLFDLVEIDRAVFGSPAE